MKLKALLFLFGNLFFTFIVFAQQTTIKGFVDLNYAYSKENNHFALGEYDQFIRSQLTDHISFLGEAIFVVEEKDFELYVMRAIATYEFSNYFRVGIGRHHNPIGYWNT